MEGARDLIQMKTGSGTNIGSRASRRVAQEAGETAQVNSVAIGASEKNQTKKNGAQSRIMVGATGRMGRRRQGRVGRKKDQKQ